MELACVPSAREMDGCACNGTNPTWPDHMKRRTFNLVLWRNRKEKTRRWWGRRVEDCVWVVMVPNSIHRLIDYLGYQHRAMMDWLVNVVAQFWFRWPEMGKKKRWGEWRLGLVTSKLWFQLQYQSSQSIILSPHCWCQTHPPESSHKSLWLYW